jgi:anhydro-N-acetylmuramic acid kinase
VAAAPAEFFVGLMSGTSLDGVDAVLAKFESGRVECLAAHYAPYEASIRAEVLALHGACENELHRAALLANRLAGIYADAVAALLAKVSLGDTPAKAIRAIGCHGQTIRHAPEHGYTLQLNNPALLAEITGIDVVADFRSRDIAAGGQGAPLVPAFHEAMFRSATTHRVILNIGGIANLTDLAPGRPTTGFDCGPGNMLLDAWIQRQLGLPFDKDGSWAQQGQLLPDLHTRLLGHPFLALPPPRSCGREQFNLDWLDTQLAGSERPEDVQATLTAFTAATVADAMGRNCGQPDELYVCGGGARNAALVAALHERLPQCRIDTTDALGLAPNRVEATAFAWLAWRTLHRQPGNLPAVTGARGPRVLGAIFPA